MEIKAEQRLENQYPENSLWRVASLYPVKISSKKGAKAKIKYFTKKMFKKAIERTVHPAFSN